jgi:hypothetical protein
MPVNWTDPDTWKLLATILGSAVAILAALGTLLRWGLKPFQWTWSKIARQVRPPNIRPRFVQNERRSFWGPAKSGDEPGTEVAGRWHVTNMSDRDVVLLRVRLDGYPSDLNHFVATEGSGGLYSPMHSVPAHQMAKVAANLMFFPPITSGREMLVADVIFTDNFENEHRVPSRFQPMAPPPPR